MARKEFDSYLKRFIRQMHKERGLICSICQKPILPEEKLTIDHWRGSDDNRPENAQPAHWHCNQKKGNSIPEDNLTSKRFTKELLELLAQDSYWNLLA